MLTPIESRFPYMIASARFVARRAFKRQAFMAPAYSFNRPWRTSNDDNSLDRNKILSNHFCSGLVSSKTVPPQLWLSPDERHQYFSSALEHNYRANLVFQKFHFKSASSLAYTHCPGSPGRKSTLLMPWHMAHGFPVATFAETGKQYSFSTGPPVGTSSSASSPSQDKESSETKSRWDRFIARLPPRWQKAWKRYGSVFVVTYFSVYFSSIGILFFLFDSGLLLPGDLPTHSIEFDGHDADDGGASVFRFIMERFGLGDYIPQEITPRMGNFAIAWLTTKIIEPLRALLTLGLTPLFARALGKVPPKEDE